jgi:hypothetical protein
MNDNDGITDEQIRNWFANLNRPNDGDVPGTLEIHGFARVV